jgi:hypothetical protein
VAGKHRKPNPLTIGLRTTGGIVAGAAVIGVAAATTQAFAGEGAPVQARAGGVWAAGAATAAHGKPAAKSEPGKRDGGKKASGKASSAQGRRAERRKPTAKDAIDLAKEQVGISENGDGQTKFQDWYMSTERARQTVARDGGSVKSYDDAAWCSMFISWVGDRIGFSDQIGTDAWTIEHARWFQDNDRWGDRPGPGAIVFFAWDGSKDVGDIRHVGMVVEDLGGGRIRTVEGNTGNAVKIRERSAGQVVGYGYPDYAK